MREWLSGGAPPCQGGGRGFDPRLALLNTKNRYPFGYLFFCIRDTSVSRSSIVSASLRSVQNRGPPDLVHRLALFYTLKTSIKSGFFFFVSAIFCRQLYFYNAFLWKRLMLISEKSQGIEKGFDDTQAEMFGRC